MKNIMRVIGKVKGLQRFLPPSLREVLSEDGVGSYSRYSGFLVVCACILWVSFLVVKNHSIPDMGGVSTFLAAGQSQYAANQLKKVVAASKTGTDAPEQKGDESASTA